MAHSRFALVSICDSLFKGSRELLSTRRNQNSQNNANSKKFAEAAKSFALAAMRRIAKWRAPLCLLLGLLRLLSRFAFAAAAAAAAA